MTKYCFVCKSHSGKQTFHRFPTDKRKLQIWCEVLKLDPLSLKKYSYTGSAHFSSSQITKKPQGRTCLRSDAIPDVQAVERSPVSSTLTAPEARDVIGNFEDGTYKMRSPASSSTVTAPEMERAMRSIGDDSFKMRSPNNFSTSTAPEKRLLPHSRKRKRLHYFGDISYDDINDPSKRKKSWIIIRKTVESQRKKSVILKQKQRRLQTRIRSLKSLIEHLKSKRLISENAGNTLDASVPESSNKLFMELMKVKTKKYSPELRKFALTLNFYSKKAYEYVRQKFNKRLPHTRTLRKWYQTVDASTGFSHEAMEALTKKSKEAVAKGSKLICNLVFDEMAIRKKVEWDGKHFYGFVDLGTAIDSDNLEEAKEAIVFMLVALNQHWKIPVAYFLVDSLNGNEKANLLLKCLEFIHETGVVVTSVTFDGPPANWTMAKKLGADMSASSTKTYFLHPLSKNKVYIFLDPSHMLKLVRNCFGSKKIIENGTGNKICWEFMDKLCDIQESQGLHVATKLRKRHLLWQREKMRVKLAVQTLSNSVAEALNFLNHDLKIKDFKGSESTAEFCKIFNNVFDIFNSRNILTNKPFEKPLSPAVQLKYFEFLDKAVEYISNLKIDGKLLLTTKRKTGFLGLIICIRSLKGLYCDHITNTTNLKYLLTYKLSQDHLEIFFSCVRSKSGFNNNPSAKQFIFTMKRLIIHSEIKGSVTANAVSLDSTSILHCTSSSLVKNTSQEELSDIESFIVSEGYIPTRIWTLTTYVDEIVKYTSGFVVKKLKNIIMCDKCIAMLEDTETHSKLQLRKAYGKMVNASMFVINICKQGEKTLRLMKGKLNLFSNNIDIVKILTLRTINDIPKDLFKSFGNHFFDEEPLSNHSYALTRTILQFFFKIRIYHELSVSGTDKVERVRSLLTKTILFKNQ